MGGVPMINIGALHYSEWAEKMCSAHLSIHITFDSPRLSPATVDEWPGSVTIHNRSIPAAFCRKDSDSLRRVFFFPESKSDLQLIEQLLEEHNRIWGDTTGDTG